MFVSILSASDVPLEDISQLVGHASINVTETVYGHEIRPALTKGVVAMDKIFRKAPDPLRGGWLPSWLPSWLPKTERPASSGRDGRI